MYLHDDSKKFRYLINKTANHYNVASSMVEKDYWVTWCIQYLFSHPLWKDHLGFKGGTCMSKVYDVIDRFSEDVDVLLDWRLLGYSKDEPLLPDSKNKKDIMKKEMNKRTLSFLDNEMLPVIQKDILEQLGDGFSVKLVVDHGLPSIMFSYPALFVNDSLSVLDEVKLEIGANSQWSQMAPYPVTSLMDGLFDGVEVFKPMDVVSVSVERTFWDKISILQSFSHWRDKNPERPFRPRNSRHYFDVYCILKKGFEESCIRNASLFFDTLSFSDRFYPVNTFDTSQVSFSDLRLSISDSLLSEIKADYEDMKGMLFGDKPKFDEIYTVILDFERKLNEFGKTGVYDGLLVDNVDFLIGFAADRSKTQDKHVDNLSKSDLSFD